MATVAETPPTKSGRFPRRKQAGFVMIGVGVVAAVVAGGMALFGGGSTPAKKPATTLDKYAYTTGVVDNWWNKSLTTSDRAAYCTAYKRDPKSTIATIQTGVNTNATAAAVFDPTAINAWFTSHCTK